MSQRFTTETEALVALQFSSEAGLGFFFDRYYSALTRYAAKITGQEALAQEMVSEAFVKLWQRRKHLKESAAVKPLLYRMVYNAAVDCLRAQKAEGKREKAYRYLNDRSSQSVGQIASAALVETETYETLYTHLRALTPRTREIFRLFYYQDQSIKEIASRLGVSVNTVKTLKLRALQQLRAANLTSLLAAVFTLLLGR